MSEKPKAPSLESLRRSIELIDEIIDKGYDVTLFDGEEKVSLLPETSLVSIHDALEWAYVFLMNRRDYHKRRQTQQKIEVALLEDELRRAGVNVEAIKRAAASAADENLINGSDDNA
jgi:hypothetical protein